MDHGQAQVIERRQESRRYYMNLPIYWRKGFTSRWRHAYLYDVSLSGVGFLVPRSSRFGVGEEIELFKKGTDKRVMCTVVRTTPWDENRTLVSSQIISGYGGNALVGE